MVKFVIFRCDIPNTSICWLTSNLSRWKGQRLNYGAEFNAKLLVSVSIHMNRFSGHTDTLSAEKLYVHIYIYNLSIFFIQVEIRFSTNQLVWQRRSELDFSWSPPLKKCSRQRWQSVLNMLSAVFIHAKLTSHCFLRVFCRNRGSGGTSCCSRSPRNITSWSISSPQTKGMSRLEG